MADSKRPALSSALHAYVPAHNPPPDAVQRELVARTRAALPDHAGMQIAQEQGPLLAFLVRLIDACHVVEIGTFTGLSALCMARALLPEGRLIACDVSAEWAEYGRAAWQRPDVADRIDLRIAPALRTLRAMPPEPHVDLAFIDADKQGYLAYWEELLPRTSGRLIAADNVCYGGQVADLPSASPNGAAIHAFNEHVLADSRVDSVMLEVADGLTLARRR